jgi:Ca-activated chloride channel family protein
MNWELADPQSLYWVILPALVAVYFLLRRRSPKRAGVIPFAGPRAFMHKESRRLRWVFRGLFLVFVGCLLVFAWIVARPVERRSWTEKSTEGIDIVLTLDVSESMDADDFHPTRLIVAKAVIQDFIRKRKYDRIGFNIFGGEAVTKSPLTRDHDFLLSQVEGVRLRELKQGTAIGMGLSNAILRLKDSQAKTKIIVLLTDGDSNVGAINPVTASQLARQQGIKIYPIGIGQKNRVIIPIYQYDDFGHRGPLITRIPSYINPALLKEIAQITGGKSYMARDSGMLNRILQEIDQLEKTKIKMLPKEKQEEKFTVPAIVASLLLLALFLLLETRFRKGAKRYVAAV